MQSYVAYTLGIHSALPLPELERAPNVRPDLVIRYGEVGCPEPRAEPAKACFHRTADECYFFWPQVGAFLARGGTEVIIDPITDATERLIRLPLLGIVLAGILEQRGYLVLHASAVAMNGRAVAFSGPSGQGKSTIAAALHARGHAILADDFVAIDLRPAETPLLLPGYPQLKLMPDAAATCLGDDPDELLPLADGLLKRQRRAVDGFSSRPVPLEQVYLLVRGAAPALDLLPPAQAVLQVMCQTYTTMVFPSALHGTKAASHFLQCASLTQRVPVCRLARPRCLATVATLAEMVESSSAGVPGALPPAALRAASAVLSPSIAVAQG